MLKRLGQALAWYTCCSGVVGWFQMWFVQGFDPVQDTAVLLALMFDNTLWALVLAVGLPIADKIRQAKARGTLPRTQPEPDAWPVAYDVTRKGSVL